MTEQDALEIRLLSYEDLPAVAAIERRAFPTPWSIAMFVLELSKPTSLCLAAVRGGRLTGYTICSRYDTVWHVMNIAVEPEARRRGIASALLAEPLGSRHAVTVLDARRGEAFVAAFAGSRELLAPRVCAPSELARWAAAAGPAALAVGDGALRFSSFLEAGGIAVAPAESALHRVSAAAICRLALAGHLTAAVPDYQRVPDAERTTR